MRVPVEICNPQEFWFVRSVDGYVSEDPDVADGRLRTYNTGDADWGLIADAVTDISRQLEDAEGDHVTVTYELPEAKADQDVLASWFGRADPVAGDPGLDGDGRHRVWKSLQARPGAVVPVRSSLRSQARVFGKPAAGDVDAVLSAVDETMRAWNEKQMDWFESYREQS